MIKVDLSGKLALVTGSTDGIGNACARGFLDAGANVAINGRSAGKVERIAGELRARYPGRMVIAAAADVGGREGCDALIAQVPQCDILVNNVAVIARDDALEASDETYRELWELNFMSALRLSRFYLPGMIERNEGRVLFIELPASVELTISYTEPGVVGDSATGRTKPATLETGAEIQVPLFIEQGEKIKVDTRDGGSYLSRVKA